MATNRTWLYLLAQMLKKRKIYFALFILLSSKVGYAQIDNEIFKTRDEIREADSQKLFLELNTFNFLRNNEYFSNIDPGQTYFGYQLFPMLCYQPMPNLKLRGGVYALLDYGTNAFRQFQPYFSANLKIKNQNFIFGNIEGALNHRLIEPLYSLERGLSNRMEHGFQYLYHSNRRWLDGWINWEQNTYRGQSRQEIFTAGLSVRETVFQAKKHSITLPLQILFFHRGGAYNPNPLVSKLNLATGVIWEIKKDKRISDWRLEGYFLAHKDASIVLTSPYKDGYAFFINLSAGVKSSRFMLNYWNATEFVSARGMEIYNSYPINDYYYIDRNRKLLFARWMYFKEIAKGLGFDFRIEPYYDFNSRQLEFSHSMYLGFKKTFNLGDIK